ncbi:class I adenylate-forming enzyme family protein [Ramlibacter sp. WS9]|uniref:class I adenylate-forming enzyme family protein n=1 Tax=Ramlibacter sp. WS9 TaxID=1882741 RepID=UPI0011428D97|nr:class I adenylate-forming enzyme family protein [Ramlibacter sp. WS9]ROZ76945.1 long-chain fatty acid--CoA ligase [Ramlibacter sp. WS9]
MSNFIFREILFYSRLNPDAPAVISGGKQFSYAHFAADIERVTRALAAEALPEGARVAVNLRGAYRSWLVLMALARMGMTSATASAPDVSHVGATIFLTDGPATGLAPGMRVLALSPEWFDRMTPEALPPYREKPQDPGALCRVVLSSGTTGVPKRVGITNEQLQWRCLFAARSYELGPTARYLSGVGMSTVAGFVIPVATWQSGGTVVLAGDDYGRALRDDRVTSLLMSPTQLAQLLERLPADAPVVPGLTLYVGGAPLSAALNEQARQRLTPNLYIAYGSTETSTATLAYGALAADRPGYVGHCLTYARVEVVDAQDNTVPTGMEGIVRVQGAGMATGYLEDAQATATSFRNGWFYPGDAGRVDATGGLQIAGRVTEVVNLGGVKIAPDVIDQALVGCPGVIDLAAFSVPGAKTDRLWIAVVASDGLDQAELHRRYAEAFPKHPPPTVVRIDKIPRNEMGKAMRARLRELIERELTSRQAKTS